MIKETISENKDKLIFIAIVLLGVPVAIAVSFLLAFHGRVYPKVSLCGQSLAGKNYEEAAQILSATIKERRPQRVVLINQNNHFTLDISSLEYLIKESSQKALKERNLKEIVSKEKNLTFDFKINREELDSQIASIAAQLYQPAINPEIKLTQDEGKKLIIIETGANGQETNIQLLNQQIQKALACPKNTIELAIPITTISPKISEEAAEETRQRATSFLDKTLELNLDEQKWIVEDEEILSFLAFDKGFNQEKIAAFAKDLAKTINTEPENAAFQFENDRVFLFKPSKDGITLAEDQFVSAFEKTLEAIEVTKENQTMEIPVTKKTAQVTTGDVNSLGIKELLGRGVSDFRGSDVNRIHNLNLASLKLNGILVPPGEEFSFNKTLGEISQATGYKQAYIIKDGRTILGDGGGVCQVSTTLFRAALNAGLPITERQPHAYRVSYYEQDMGPGFDSTVFSPSPDLKFRNNTPAYILIQTKVDLTGKKLIFDIYGTNDSRKVEISKVRIWDRVAPPPDLYQDDPTLPIGTVKQVEHKSWGAKTAFDYKVTRGEEVLTEKTFFSTYRPWQAVYLRGTRP
ncbi:MAG: VanW family protein [Patescibacteria group bacterium]|jgi:vancomycin resistance protein YoaR